MIRCLLRSDNHLQPGRIKLQSDPGCCDDISAICDHGHCLRAADLHFHTLETASVRLVLVEKVLSTSGSADLKMFGLQQCPECFSCCFPQQLQCSWARITDALLKRDSALYVYADSLAAHTHLETFNVKMLNLETCISPLRLIITTCFAATVMNYWVFYRNFYKAHLIYKTKLSCVSL